MTFYRCNSANYYDTSAFPEFQQCGKFTYIFINIFLFLIIYDWKVPKKTYGQNCMGIAGECDSSVGLMCNGTSTMKTCM
jgi:hypothetical protein